MIVINIFIKLFLFTFFLSSHQLLANDYKETIFADTSVRDIKIEIDFNGEKLLIFGAMNKFDDDVVILVKGPPIDLLTRKKEKISSIWINNDSFLWKGAPSFYQIISTEKITKILSQEILIKNELGIENLNFYNNLNTSLLALDSDKILWKKALIQNMHDKKLWINEDKSLIKTKGLLFKAQVLFPTTIIPGEYIINIMQVRNEKIISKDFTKINVKKHGIGSLIYKFANKFALFYGIFAVFFAIFSGWLAAIAFMKR